MSESRTRNLDVDWRKTPPFITSESGPDGCRVVVRVRSIHELHAAYDIVSKGFSDWLADRLSMEWADANQG
jgi:hypothetical protein